MVEFDLPERRSSAQSVRKNDENILSQQGINLNDQLQGILINSEHANLIEVPNNHD